MGRGEPAAGSAFAGKKTTLTYDGNGSLVRKDDGIGVTTYAGAGTEVYQIPAGRDLVGDDFYDGNAGGWSPTGGTWAVENRAYSGQGNAISLWTPTFRTGKVWAKVQTQSLGAIAHNGYLVFDYRDADNYRFAGLQDDSNQCVIGEKLTGTLYTRAAASEPINTGQWYSLELVVSGSTASLCFCQLKTEPFDHRKESHLGHLACSLIIENRAI